MRSLQRHLARIWIIAGVLTMLAVAPAAPALADTIGATGALSGTFTAASSGSLTFAATVDGTAKNITSSGAILDVADFVQPSTGWNITVNPSQFTSGANTLATTALSVTAGGTATCAPSTTCTVPPVNVTTYPVALTAGSASKIYSTATGTGSYNLSPTFSLHIAASDPAGSYSSTLTVAYTQGP